MKRPGPPYRQNQAIRVGHPAMSITSALFTALKRGASTLIFQYRTNRALFAAILRTSCCLPTKSLR